MIVLGLFKRLRSLYACNGALNHFPTLPNLLSQISYMRKDSSGFTLVEISIVLVIVGLIIGGVLTGRNLIKAAEIRGIISEMHSLKSATYIFKGKYRYYPGDIPNPDIFWAPPPEIGWVSENSNNDVLGDGVIVSAEGKDGLYQLKMLDMLKGEYTHHGSCKRPGRGAAVSVLTSAGWGLGFNSLFMKNTLFFGSEAQQFCNAPILSPTDAWTIDTKVDDGKPRTGQVIGWHSNCYTANDYDVNTSTIECSLDFLLE